MMATSFTESVVEDAALAWLAGLGFTVKHGPDIAAGHRSILSVLVHNYRNYGTIPA